MQVVIDDLMIRYQQAGKGKSVVLLHGWGDTLATFHDLYESLSKDYQVTVLDLPGFGQSQAPHEVWNLDAYAVSVAAFLKKLGLKPFAFVGHSNGGAILVRGLSKGVLKTNKLVLLDSAGIRGEYRGRVKAVRLMTKTGKALSRPLPHSIRDRLRQKVYQAVGSDMLVAEHLQESFKLVVTDDVREDAAKLKLPTLLLYGEDDKATPPSFGETLHVQIRGSEFEVISAAGHFAHHDQPEQVRRLVMEFLKK